MKEKYKNLSDEELISVLRDGDKEAIDILLDKYKSMVLGKAKSMYILGGDSDDLIQEGMLGLFKAVRDYDCGSVEYSVYYYKYRGQIVNCIVKQQYFDYKGQQQYTKLYHPVYD